LQHDRLQIKIRDRSSHDSATNIVASFVTH
jgi:hypothetical protein